MPKYFAQPFAAAGDRTPIPETSGTGTVNYADGFGPDYSLDPGVDADAKRVPRGETNQFYFDVSENLRQYQLNGWPAWVSAADAGGTQPAYANGTGVRFGGVTYMSIVDGNTATPGTDATKWRAIDAFSFAALSAVDADYVTPSSNVKLVTPAGLAKAVREGRLAASPANVVGTAYTLALPGVTFAQAQFAEVSFTVPSSSPAGPLTLKVNALATLPLQTSIETDPAVGDLQPNRIYTARSTGSKWLIVQGLPSQASAAPQPIPDRLASDVSTVPAVASLNPILASGWYRAAAGVTGGPAPLAAEGLFVVVQTSNPAASTQIVTGFASSTEADTRMYQRSFISGAWQPWRRVYSSGTELQQIAVPAGCTMHYAGLTVPNGWFLSNGQAIPRTQFPALFAAIGTLYGTGDGSTTFNLPNELNPLGDGRGAFVRAGSPDGVTYPDTTGPHTHTVNPPPSNSEGGQGFTVTGNTGSGETLNPYSTETNAGSETAPLHVRRLPIIKY